MIAAGCTWRPATITKPWKPVQPGWAIISAGGEKLAWEFTPMLGGVFGVTTGIAPGYKGSLSW